jgi:hypothetical protein
LLAASALTAFLYPLGSPAAAPRQAAALVRARRLWHGLSP